MAIFDLNPSVGDSFVIFYVEAERLITLTQNRGTDIIDLYDIILTTIDNSLLSNTKGLKIWFTQSYEIGQKKANHNNISYYLEIVSFVGELQLLVLKRYNSIDEFYEGEEIIVSQVFADISEDAGYPISPQYIEDIS